MLLKNRLTFSNISYLVFFFKRQTLLQTIESEFTHHYTQCRVFKQTLENAENKMRKDPFIPW